jgi:group I intron endonuclease
MIKCGIYIIRNIINGKKYIGSSINIKGRWYTHKGQLCKNIHSNSHLQSAFNKYRKENFEFMVLEECPENMLIIREQAWMDIYKTQDRNFGYNISNADSSTNRGRKATDATKLKMSIVRKGRSATWNIGRKPSPETIEKMSNSQTGRKHSPETKEKMSKWQIGKKHSPETIEKMRARALNRKCNPHDLLTGRYIKQTKEIVP